MPRFPPVCLVSTLCAWTVLTFAGASSAQTSPLHLSNLVPPDLTSSVDFGHRAIAGLAPGEATPDNPGMTFGQPRTVDPLWDGSVDDDEQKDATTPWTLSLEGVTHAPVDMGVQVLFETPFGLRVGSGFGWVPQMYINWVSNAAVSTGAVDGATGSAVRDSFSGGTVWRANVGVRPVGGFYLDAGYALVNLRGTLSVSELASASNIDSAGFVPEGAGMKVRSTLHMWTLEVGWQTHIADRVVLGFGAGVMGTINASSTAEPDFDVPDVVSIDPIVEEATNTADDRIKRYGFIPTVTGRLGYDFL